MLQPSCRDERFFRIASGVPLQRKPQRKAGPGAIRYPAHLASDRLRAALLVVHAAAGGVAQRRGDVETLAVVFDGHGNTITAGRCVHANPTGAGMAQDIGDAFLHDAQDMQSAGRLQPVQRRQFLHFPYLRGDSRDRRGTARHYSTLAPSRPGLFKRNIQAALRQAIDGLGGRRTIHCLPLLNAHFTSAIEN